MILLQKPVLFAQSLPSGIYCPPPSMCFVDLLDERSMLETLSFLGLRDNLSDDCTSQNTIQFNKITYFISVYFAYFLLSGHVLLTTD